MTVSVILLAGGKGLRMGNAVPKQYLPLKGKMVAQYSLDLFSALPDVNEIIVVCDPTYIPLFPSSLQFAEPGNRRQDSVWNGLQKVLPRNEYICVHDAARPLADSAMFQRVLKAAQEKGAATVGMPLSFTIKEACEQQIVIQTPDRNRFWEIQTPQVLRKEILLKGLQLALEQGITVTDDVSAAELLSYPVKLVEGSYQNLKITTTKDLLLAERLLS